MARPYGPWRQDAPEAASWGPPVVPLAFPNEDPGVRILCIDKHETNAGWGAEGFLGAALESAGTQTLHVDYERHRGRVAEALRAESTLQDVDAVLVQRGTGYVFPAAVLAAFGVPRVLLLTELVSRARVLGPLLGCGLFDHVFVRTPTCARTLVERGWIAADAVSVFLSACPDAYLDAGAAAVDEASKDIDVLWVGSVLPRRRRLLDELRRRVEIAEAQAFGADMVALVRRARVVLNLHAEERLDTETRVYEVLGAQGFLVSEPLSSECPFEAGRHYVEGRAGQDLALQIQHFLADPEARHTIAAAGHAEVRARHTYAARARQVETVLERLGAARRAVAVPVDLDALGRVTRREKRRALRTALLRPVRAAVARVRGR